jgi:hypothetical protein
VTLVPPYPGSGWSGAEGPGRKIWGGSGAAPPASGSVLVAFMSGGDAAGVCPVPIDLSTHPWTKLYWSGNMCRPTLAGCGAGPPDNQSAGVWVRDVVPGESATVLEARPDGSLPTVSAWVYQLNGVIGGAAAIALAFSASNVQVDNGALVTLNAAVGGTESVLLASVQWSKVSYDLGWCAGYLAPSAILTTTQGIELVNASCDNICDGGVPWSWIAQAGPGTGTLTAKVQSLAGSYGSGAYTCGWKVADMGVTIPVDGGVYAIAQQGFNIGGVGVTTVVTLPSPP